MCMCVFECVFLCENTLEACYCLFACLLSPSLSFTLSVYTTHCYRRTLTALLASHRPTRGARRRRAAATAKATTKYATTTIVNRSSNSLCRANRVAHVVVVVVKGVVVVLKRMLGLELCVVCVCVCVLFGIFGHYLISVN